VGRNSKKEILIEFVEEEGS